MDSKAQDYINEISSQYDELLRTHRESLARKSIHRKQDLIKVIKLDLDKLTHALLEVQETQAKDILEDFFADTDMDLEQFDLRLQAPYINHVGFEIHEPLDLVLFGIQHWIEQSRIKLGAEIQIQGSLRFPASQAFQQRVGAYTEILRIRLLVNGRVLMLELFDIQHSLSGLLRAGSHRMTHRNFDGLFRQEEFLPGHRERLAQLFASDQIWHYAFHVKRPEDVMVLHDQIQSLAARAPWLRVAYAQPVHNPHDRSLHTKVISQGADRARSEVEFVTEFSTQQPAG